MWNPYIPGRKCKFHNFPCVQVIFFALWFYPVSLWAWYQCLWKCGYSQNLDCFMPFKLDRLFTAWYEAPDTSNYVSSAECSALCLTLNPQIFIFYYETTIPDSWMDPEVTRELAAMTLSVSSLSLSLGREPFFECLDTELNFHWQWLQRPSWTSYPVLSMIRRRLTPQRYRGYAASTKT